MNTVQKFIENQQNNRSEFLLFNKIPLFVRDQIESENSINIIKLIKQLESFLPEQFKYLIKSIIILDDPSFKERDINAFYHEKKLYVSNQQDDLNDILDDIVHEFAHALEEEYSKNIYADQEIENEFLKKRKLLKIILQAEGFDLSNYDFAKLEYDKNLDDLFYKTVTYEKINNATNYGLFVSPYATTSLREYFATGFEEYVLGDVNELKNISPKIYNKLNQIFNKGETNE